MGSVDEKTSSRIGEEKIGKEEKDQAKQQQAQMGLPLKDGSKGEKLGTPLPSPGVQTSNPLLNHGMKDLESNLEKILQSQASQPDSTGLAGSVNQSLVSVDLNSTGKTTVEDQTLT